MMSAPATPVAWPAMSLEIACSVVPKAATEPRSTRWASRYLNSVPGSRSSSIVAFARSSTTLKVRSASVSRSRFTTRRRRKRRKCRRARSRCSADSGTDEYVLVKLARAAAGAPVDVARQTLLKGQRRPIEDLRIEILRVVHHDDHRCPSGKLPTSVGERRDHVLDVVADGGLRLTTRGRADLLLTAIFESEQLVGVTMLLVIVDQSRVR